MKKIIFCFLFILSSSILMGEEKKVFQVYGKDFMVNVSLPDYWMVDMDYARKHDINGLFFIKDFGVHKTPVGIILLLTQRPNMKSKLNDYIKYDKELLKEYYPNMIYQEFKSNQKQKNKYLYKIFEFYNEPKGRHQYIAYIDCYQKYLVKLYIDIKVEKDVDKYVSDFLESVYGLSYFNVNIKTK